MRWTTYRGLEKVSIPAMLTFAAMKSEKIGRLADVCQQSGKQNSLGLVAVHPKEFFIVAIFSLVIISSWPAIRPRFSHRRR